MRLRASTCSATSAFTFQSPCLFSSQKKASTAAAEVLAQLASDVEEALLKPLVDDLEIFKRVHDKIKERRGIEKEFGHYVQKLGDLRTKVSFRKTFSR